MNTERENFIQQNSSDGGFLQSEEWRKFQEAVGKKTFCISGEDFSASIIEHALPIVGRYFYIPRGPVTSKQGTVSNKQYMEKIINLAKENKAGWIRFDPANKEVLKAIKNNLKYKIKKAPHDMQPREIFVMNMTKSEEELLKEMKSKTRYNIKLAHKKEVRIKKREVSGEYIEEFLRLTKIMAKRQGIVPHPDKYYEKMFETIPAEILKLYVAEYDNKIIAVNLVIFYGKTATYLHGASDDKYKNLMAPYLLQWKQIQDAKAAGCARYDFGGISTNIRITNKWAGITRFKLGFSPNTKSIEFPGSYDIIINRKRYCFYRIFQKIRSIINKN